MDSQLWAFVIVATFLAVTPGADTLLVVRNVLTRGRTAGLATTGGIAVGCFVHAALSAIGVSLILVRSAEAFEAVKLGGAAYLIVLGVQSVRRWRRVDDGPLGPAATRVAGGPGPSRRLRSFLEGLLTNLLNPKVGGSSISRSCPSSSRRGIRCSRDGCSWGASTSASGWSGCRSCPSGSAGFVRSWRAGGGGRAWKGRAAWC